MYTCKQNGLEIGKLSGVSTFKDSQDTPRSFESFQERYDPTSGEALVGTVLSGLQ